MSGESSTVHYHPLPAFLLQQVGCIGYNVHTVASYCDLHKRVLVRTEDRGPNSLAGVTGILAAGRGSSYYPINRLQPDTRISADYSICRCNDAHFAGCKNFSREKMTPNHCYNTLIPPANSITKKGILSIT